MIAVNSNAQVTHTLHLLCYQSIIHSDRRQEYRSVPPGSGRASNNFISNPNLCNSLAVERPAGPFRTTDTVCPFRDNIGDCRIFSWRPNLCRDSCNAPIRIGSSSVDLVHAPSNKNFLTGHIAPRVPPRTLFNSIVSGAPSGLSSATCLSQIV